MKRSTNSGPVRSHRGVGGSASGGSEAARRLNVALVRAVGDFRKAARRRRHQRDAESVHQLRIQSRRLVVWCDLLKALDRGSMAREARRRIKKTLRALARLRDSQVEQKLLGKVPARAAAGAAILRRSLRRAQPRCERQLEARCRRLHPSRIGDLLLGSGKSDPVFEGVACSSGLEEVIGKWLEEMDGVTRRRLRAARASRPASLHRLRIAVKHLRYGLEELAPCLPGISRKAIRHLQRLQAKLGAIQDLDVCRIRLESLAVGHPLRTTELEPLRQWLVLRRNAAIRSLLRVPNRILPRRGSLRVVRRSQTAPRSVQ